MTLPEIRRYLHAKWNGQPVEPYPTVGVLHCPACGKWLGPNKGRRRIFCHPHHGPYYKMVRKAYILRDSEFSL